MGEQDLRKGIVAIRDQLGKLPEINAVGVWDYDEDIGIEEGATVVKSQGIGTALILDHPTNSKLDSGNVLGSGGKDTAVVQRVVNPNNTFKEHFRENQFEDTAKSTSSFDTTNFRWESVSGDVSQTLSIFKNKESIASITPKLIIEGISVQVQLNTTANPGGVQKNIT